MQKTANVLGQHIPIPREKRIKAQPNQQKQRLQVYNSSPMNPSQMHACDMQHKDDDENIGEPMFNGTEEEKMTMVKGGKVVEKTLQDINILQALSHQEAQNSTHDE